MIKFKSVTYRNFLSTGNVPITIDLSKPQSTLVTGKNGAGKSTFIDAITVGLYGKSYRRINKPQLANTTNKKDCIIEVLFSKDGDEYRVVRHVETSKFDIYKNGQLIDKLASSVDQQIWFEQTVLRMNYQTFCQIVILGSANYVPFMLLQAAQRRAIVENILDIGIFTEMNVILKERLTQNRDLQEEQKRNAIALALNIKSQEKLIESKQADRKKYIDDIRTNLQGVKESVNEIQKKIQELQTLVQPLEGLRKIKNDSQLNSLQFQSLASNNRDKITKLKTQEQFFVENSKCDKCKQHVSRDHAIHEADHIKRQIKEEEILLDLNSQRANEIALEGQKAEKQIKQLETHEREINKQQGLLQAKVDEGRKLAIQLKQLESAYTTNQDVQKEIDLLNQHKADSIKLADDINVTSRKQAVLDLANKLLKDSGIKSAVIKQYVKAMNQQINYYLEIFDFYCNFQFDENFDESINARGKQDFTYCSFSMGERMRIDLALLFAWREMARVRSQASTNLLIFDEIFDSSLDANGADQLLDILNGVASNNSVFVISHRGHQLAEKIPNHIMFEKVNGFSKLVSE